MKRSCEQRQSVLRRGTKSQRRGTSTGKRVLSVLLTCVMVLGLFPAVPVYAADTAITGSISLVNGGHYSLSTNLTGKTITVPNGVTATVTVPAGKTVTLDNQTAGGSPFSVAAGGTLNLVVNGTLRVYGQAAQNGHEAIGAREDTDSRYTAAGGSAAIRVPVGATLDLRGTGLCYAYGGDAGDGGNIMTSADKGAGSGGGAGAGIGGNGGSGGMGATWHNSNDTTAGGAGESAGAVRIAGTVKVFAYGGGGGAGGASTTGPNSAAAGSGGYPAAGIGGGGGGASGAGGSNGGGGFTGGVAQSVVIREGHFCVKPDGTKVKITSADLDVWSRQRTQNGMGGRVDEDWAAGGGYFQRGEYGTWIGSADGGYIGGGGGASKDEKNRDITYNGGAAGNGGSVVISTLPENVHAYNGAYMTEKGSQSYISSDSLACQTPIYAQLGYSLDAIRNAGVYEVTGRTAGALSFKKAGGTATVAKTIGTTSYGLGIGSGAGYTETSNGTVSYEYIDINMSTVTSDQTLTERADGKIYRVFGASSQYNVTVASGNVGVLLDGVTIDMRTKTGKSAFVVNSGANASVGLKGTNTLSGGVAGNSPDASTAVVIKHPTFVDTLPGGAAAGAGMRVPSGASIALTGSGTLYAYGGDAGDSGKNCRNGTDTSTDGGSGGGGGAGAGIGGAGGVGGWGTQGGAVQNNAARFAYSKGGAGEGAGSITVDAKVYAYGGGGGSSGEVVKNGDGGGTGGGGYPAAGIGGGGAGGGGGTWGPGGGGFSGGNGQVSNNGGAANSGPLAPAVNGAGGQVQYNCGAGGGYFAKGADGLEGELGGGAIYGGGGYRNSAGRESGAGDGGAGGAGGTIVIVNSDLVKAYNGSWVTTSASGSAGNEWGLKAMGSAGNESKKIRSQATQGYGAGAGFTETDGNITFMGAPGAPTAAAAVLAGSYGEKVTVSWVPPTNTGGTGVALTGYTIVSAAQGISKTVTLAECTVSGGRTSVTLDGLTANMDSDFVVYANNMKGTGPASNKVNITTKGAPLAPLNVEARVIAGTSDQAEVLWNEPDLTYNNNEIKKYTITLTPIGKADPTTEDLFDILMEYDGEDDLQGTAVPVDPEAVTVTKTVLANETPIDDITGKYILNCDGLHFGTVYQVSVVAENGAGTGDANMEAKLETPSVATAPAVTVTKPDAERSDLTVQWLHPDNARDGNIPELTAFFVTRTAVDERKNEIASEKMQWSFEKQADGGWQTADGLNLTVDADDKGVVRYAFTDNTLAESGLNGRTYTYTVQGVNLPGKGLEGKGLYSFAPIAPAGLQLKANTSRTGQLTLQWNKATENGNAPVEGYYLYRNGTRIATIEAGTESILSYTDTGADLDDGTLAPGVQYTYTVSAYSASGEGLASEELKARVNGGPEVPATMTATATGATTATVSWTAPATLSASGIPGSGGYMPDGTTPLSIEGYKVTWTDKQSGNASSVRLYVKQSEGYNLPCDKDGNLATLEPGSSVYSLCLNPDAMINEQQFFKLDVSTGKYTYTIQTGMEQGRNYNVEVAAVNEVCDGTPKAYSVATWTTPRAPRNLTVTPITASAQFEINWESSVSIGTPVSNYLVRVYLADEYGHEGASAKFETSVTPEGSLFAETDTLEAGVEYAIEVTPYNEVGAGAPAVAYSSAVSLPSAPETVSASAVGADRVDVAWDNATATGGSEIIRYEVMVYAYDTLGDPSKKSLITYGTPETANVGGKTVLTYSNGVAVTYPQGQLISREATVTGLEGWTDYEVRVQAYNNDNPTKPGTYNSATARTMRAPYAVEGLTVSATGGKAELNATWEAPMVNGGSKVTRYYVELYKGAFTEGQIRAGDAVTALLTDPQDPIFVSGGTLTYTFAGTVNGYEMKNGETYTIRVIPENIIGKGDGAVGSAYPVQGADAPTNAAIQMHNGTSLKFSWTNPVKHEDAELDGFRGGMVSGYQVTLADASGNAIYVLTTDENGVQTNVETSLTGVDMALTTQGGDGSGETISVEVTGLIMGQQYQLRANVRTDVIGNGASTAPIAFKMWTLPDQPYDIKVLPTSVNGGLRLQWQYPLDDGDSDNDPTTNTGNHTSVTDYRVYWRHSGAEAWTLIEWDAEFTKLATDTAAAGSSYANVMASGVEKGVSYLTFTGLTDGDTYEFKVTSMNGAGWGTQTASTLYSAAPCSVPQAPAIGQVLTGNRIATITSITPPDEWVTVDGTQVLGNGGAEITGYKLYAAPAKLQDGKWVRNGNWIYKSTVSADNNETVRILDLENGTDYMIMARAINAACTGDFAAGGEASNEQYVRVGMPLTPQNVKADLGLANSAVTTYDAAEGNGSPILYYKAYVGKLDDKGEYLQEPAAFTKELVNGALVDTGKAIEYVGQIATVYGDEMGETLTIQISAVNRVGESPLSEPVTVTVGAPSVPTITSLEKSQDAVSLTWNEASSNGAKMQHYYVYLRQTAPGKDQDSFDATEHKYAVGAKTLSLNITKFTPDMDLGTITLSKGAKYEVQVAAENLAGEGPRSEAWSFTFGVPQKPTIETVDFGKGSLTLTFTPPTDTGGTVNDDGVTPEPLTGFAIYANGMLRKLVTLQADQAGTPGTGAYEGLTWEGINDTTIRANEDGTYTVVVDGLANGSAYNMQVSALNQYGEGDKSNAESKTPATIAGAPTNVTAAATSDTSATLSWKAPAYNGGSSIEAYVVTVFDAATDNPLASSEPTEADSGSIRVMVTGTNAQVTGLSRGGSYYFKVQARTKVSELGTPGVSKTITTFTLPGAPIIESWESKLASKGSAYDLTITWTAPADNGGTDILGYNVYCGGGKENTTLLSANVNSFTISDLSHNATYLIRVSAVNSVGETKSEALSARIGQLSAPVVTDITSALRPGSTTQADLTVHFLPVEGTTTGYYLFNLADTDNFPTLAKEDGTPDIDKIMSLNTSQINNLLTRAVQLNQYMGGVNDGYATELTVTRQNVGQTYYLVLTAYSTTSGVGVPTAVYPVTVGAPDAPVLVQAEAGYKSVTASWRAPANLNLFDSCTLQGYQFYLDGKALGDMIPIAELNLVNGSYSRTVKVPPALCGGDGRLTVAAITSDSASGATLAGRPSEALQVCPWDLPSAPVSEEPVVGNATFTITFHPANGNGLAVTGYKIYWDGSLVSESRVSFTENADGTISATVVGVKNGYKPTGNPDDKQGYPVHVSAYTTDESGVRYESIENTEYLVATGIPSAPVIETVAAGATNIALGWSDTELISGDKWYTVRISSSSGASGSFTLYNNTMDITTVGDSGPALQSGNRYTITVSTTNDIGESEESEPVSVVLGAPQAPGNVNAIPDNGKATVTWNKPNQNAGPITKYYIYVEGENGVNIKREIDRNQLSGTVDGLENGVKYRVWVTAENALGESVASNICTVTPGAISEAPASATATALNDTSVEITWQPPADNGGLPINFYLVEGGGKTVVVNGESPRTAVIEELTAGTQYTFTVTATNDVGTSGACTTNAVTTHTAPGKPSWERLSSVNGTITAMWYPPENTGGEGTAIKSYTMYIRAFDNEGNLIQEPLYTIENIVADETNTNAKGYITYVVDKDQYPLSLYADYKVSVAAYNTTVNTIGQECDMLTVTVTGALADTAPGSPTGITAEAGNQQVRLSWNAPIYDGGGIDNYYIYYGVKAAEGASQSWKRISVSGNKTDEIVSGLVNDTEYVFYITACNRNGESDPSFTTSATPLKLDAPSAVTNLRYFSTADNSQIVFRWDASTGEQVKYRVYITNLGTGGDAMSSEISATALTLNVLPGVQYRFEVEAFNAGGTSPKAGITAMSTLNVDVNSNGDYVAGAMGNPDANFDGVADPVDRVTVPGEPTNLRANVSGTSSINLSWAAPENTGGKDTVLSKYRVYVDGTYVELDAHDSDGTPVTSYRYDNSGSGIKPGSVYTFQVSALNEEAGEGSRSSTLQVYVQASDAPAIVEATVSGYTTLNLTWTPPQTTDEVEGYYLQLNGLDGTAPLIGTGETDDGNITYSAATLTPDTETVVRVFAKFKDGHTGKYSDAVIVSSKLETPAAPVLTSAEANVLEGEGKDAVTVQWEAVPGATSYKVYLTGSVDMPVTQEVFDATTATITIDSTPGTYTVYVTALNAPGGIGLSKESARSAMKTVTTLSLSDYAPAQVENVNVSVDRADQTVTLSWDPVALPELSDGNTCFTGIQYVVYGRALSASTLSGAELQTLAVTDTPEAIVPVELNREYAFQVMAFNVYDETAEGGTLVEGVTPETLDVDAGDTPIQLIGFAGLRSDLVEASTENQTPVPGAPENLSYSYNAQTGEVTLSWTAPSVNGENVTGYKVYGDYQGGTQTVIFDENNLVNALTCTFTVAAEEGKTDYMYQVSAVVVDDTTGENEYIEGAKSAALTVSTEQPPANPDAPSITRYVFRYETVDEVQGTQKGMITLYWKAPTDLEKEANNHITAYTVLLNNGEVAVIDLTDEAVDSSTYYNEATGEYFYVFDCNEVGIFTPDAYEVAVRATAVVDAFTLHSGLQEQAYKIAFGNNEDTDGDGVADKNLDENGDGIVEDVVITVRLNGTVTAGGSTREVLVFTLLDESGNEVTNDRYTLEVQDDGSFSLALKVSAASQADAGGVAMFALLDEPVGGYTLKVSKDGCTSYTITDIPLSADIAEINLGIVTLYAGDVNGDGIVDFLDDNVVALNYNLDGASVAQGDVNGDGVVDFLDSNTINLNYNKESITKSWT